MSFPLVLTLALSLLSILSSAFVILKIVFPVLVIRPLSRQGLSVRSLMFILLLLAEGRDSQGLAPSVVLRLPKSAISGLRIWMSLRFVFSYGRP